MRADIRDFLDTGAFGVVGASSDRHKFGNRVLRCYQQDGRKVLGINPHATEIEGSRCVASVLDLPADVTRLSIITPPAMTEQVVEQAARKGITHIWMQPGAESPRAVELCRQHGIHVIADGSCLLVELGFRGGT